MVTKSTIGDLFKRIDFFQTNASFRVKGGDSFASVFGACMSLLVGTIIALYGFNRFIIMRQYEDTNYMEYSIKNGLTEEVIGQD